MGHCGKKWNQAHHATIMGAQLYVKINHNNSGPMEHKNTTQDRNHVLLWFIVTTGQTRHMNCRSQFRLLLHFHSPVTIAESHHPYTTIQWTCTTVSILWIQMFQILLSPRIKPNWFCASSPNLKLGSTHGTWPNCNPNRTISFTGSTHRLTKHQVTSWTQQLYKDKNTWLTAQAQHHPNPSTLLAKTTVTDTMKICPFYDQPKNSPHRYLHGDRIHLHVPCSNTHLIRIRNQSNTNISTALQYLGIFHSLAIPPQPRTWPIPNFPLLLPSSIW